MIDMDAVGRQVEAGRAELAASSKAILSLATRTRIWKTMLDPQDDEASYRRQIELKMACVRHVQHLWDRAFPGDGRLEEMLALAQELIDQQADPKQANRRAGSFIVHVRDELADVHDLVIRSAVLVADAASSTTISACFRDPIRAISDDAKSDDELLPDTLEPSYCCAGAAAHAPNWMPIEKTDVPARRAFWTWYLDEAIPQVLAN